MTVQDKLYLLFFSFYTKDPYKSKENYAQSAGHLTSVNYSKRPKLEACGHQDQTSNQRPASSGSDDLTSRRPRP